MEWEATTSHAHNGWSSGGWTVDVRTRIRTELWNARSFRSEYDILYISCVCTNIYVRVHGARVCTCWTDREIPCYLFICAVIFFLAFERILLRSVQAHHPSNVMRCVYGCVYLKRSVRYVRVLHAPAMMIRIRFRMKSHSIPICRDLSPPRVPPDQHISHIFPRISWTSRTLHSIRGWKTCNG